ncbi:MAG: GH92 family glycosyl hydrolase, partial [Duncaniella sp.]|nr:GH92 family glycosyl hydrolase [Duncaniella sp.]
IGDLGDILFVPTRDHSVSLMRFSHDNECARPGYYSVRLEDAGVDVELTATTHAGVHRYRFAEGDSAYVKVNLAYGIGWDRPVETQVEQAGDSAVSGYRYSRGWADDQKIYFHAEFSRPMARYEKTDDTLAVCVFAPSAEPLVAKVGLSAKSVERARANLYSEVGDADFDTVMERADRVWNDNLGRVTVKTSNDRDKRLLYTSLFHTMTAPVTYSDAEDEERRYSVFSLWDTYRAAHPMYTLLFPEMQTDIAATFMDIFRQQGKLPVWHLHGNETDCMVGNPGVIVLGDLVLKGLTNDMKGAYEAMRASAMLDERSLGELKRYGYIPFDLEGCGESVAKGLEYAIADDAVAKVASRLRIEDTLFRERARAYRRYFDPTTGFMRGLDSKGRRREGAFDPFAATHRADDYCEGNAWQYVWLVPHDPHGLIELFGSEEAFVSKLDSLFVAEGNLGADASPDISGMIGQYAHGNEPSHHVVYLYNYAGQPYKGAPLLRRVLTELYRDDHDGLCGNEDVGQMSAWYVLSSIGIYQVEPAGGRYVIGSPLFDSATIKLPGEKSFTVSAKNNSPGNMYVQSASLNGNPYTKGYIDYEDIMRGGVLELVMGDS